MGTVDLNDLPVFVAIAETRSFSAAARRLDQPKSSVSRAIARLEADLGVRLLHRTTRHVSLSTAGTALYERVAAPLTTLRDSVGELPEHEQLLSGVLRVTAPPDFAVTALAEAAVTFAARHPQLELDLRVSNELVDLVAQGVDLAIRFSTRRLEDSSLSARRVGSFGVHLFASPGYLARHGTPRTPRDLEDHEWVRFRAATTLRLHGPDGATVATPRGRIVADDLLFVHAALVADAGIGFLEPYVADPDVAAGRLVRVLPRWSLHGGYMWLVRPGSRNVPRKVSVFIDFLLDYLRTRGILPRES